MTEREIQSMISEIQSSEYPEYPAPMSFQIPETPELQQTLHTRTNHQLVRSLLYMGYLIRKAQVKQDDTFVNALETITSVMDNIYLLTKFGVAKDSRFLAGLSKNASKVWFITLLLMIKRLLGNIIKLWRLKSSISSEMKSFEDGASGLKNYLKHQYQAKVENIKNELLTDVLELIGTLNDLFFVCIELFGWEINKRAEWVIGFLSTMMSVYRMSRSR